MYSAKFLGNTAKLLFAALLLWGCGRTWRPVQESYSFNNIRVDSAQFESDSAMEAFLEVYRRQVDSLTSRVLVSNEVALYKGLPESALGNLLTDLSLQAAPDLLHIQPQVCLYNNGGLRVPLPQGNITVGKVYELMPFDNRLVIVHLPGWMLKEVVRTSCRKGGDAWGGVRFSIDTPSMTMSSLFLQGEPVRDSAIYQLLTSDYVANGGDQYSILKKAPRVEDSGWLLRDYFIRLFENVNQQGRSLKANKDGRVRYE